jgi:uncharacterized protein YjbI with pentapeptide repeats
MPYLFDPSKLNYSGNKVAVRNLISVCNVYEEIYSNLRAQLTLVRDSINSWYSVWNGAFQHTDILINAFDPEHKQFLKQLAIILDLFYNNINSILSNSSVPITMHYSKGFFTYYTLINNNLFLRKDLVLALDSVKNLVINCTTAVINLSKSESNASTITQVLPSFNLQSTDSTLIGDKIDDHDVSGYTANSITGNNCIFRLCSDISNSNFTNCKFISTNCTSSTFNNTDLSDCNLFDVQLVKTKLINCDLSNNIVLTDSVIDGTSITGAIVLNSVINKCTLIKNSDFTNCYLNDISNSIDSTFIDSDTFDVLIANSTISNCSVINGQVLSCDLSNTYFKNVDISGGSSTLNNTYINCAIENVNITTCILSGINNNSVNSLGAKSSNHTGSIKRSTIINCDLSGMYIEDCDLSCCNINNCNIVNNSSIHFSSVINCTGTGGSIYNSNIYPIMRNLISEVPTVIPSNNIEYTDNMFRTLRLKYLVGRLNNIGCYCNTLQKYDFVNPIIYTNSLIGGRYFFKIGDFATEVLSVNIRNKTIGDIFKGVIGSGLPVVPTQVTLEKPTSITDESNIYETNATPIIESFTRMMDEINFSSGLLEDSRNLFNALL